jgi:hypothetical protein
MRIALTKIVFLFISLISLLDLKSQILTQTLYGNVKDIESGEALYGATIVVPLEGESLAAMSDLDGNYMIENVPVGRIHVKISYMGYETAIFTELLLSSGKALNLDVSLQESFEKINEVVVTGKKAESSHLKVDNEMATVSGMSYSIEQGARYAGSNNDPSRLVLSFPGVRNQGDIQNGISIRGNTPTALLWNIEGLEVPSPNHFAREGSLGAVNMMSNYVMQSIDFYTAAFPAQYGNAGSGVFDIQYRKGNPEEYEFSIGAGSLGVEASAEGPFSKKYKGSFLLAYRYSTLGILSKLGYSIGSNAGPVYQDFNYSIHLPSKKLGQFKIFGLMGDSYIRPLTINEFKDGEWSDEYRMGLFGIGNQLSISDKTMLKTSLAFSQTRGFFRSNYKNLRFKLSEDSLQNELAGLNEVFEKFPIIEKRLQFDVKTSTKVSSKHSFQSGINLQYIHFNQSFKREVDQYKYNEKKDQFIYKKTKIDSSAALLQSIQVKAFMQHKYRISDVFSVVGGLHFIHFNYTKFFSVEPRIGFEYTYGNNHKLTFGAGFHSRLEALGFYGTASNYWENVGSNFYPNFVVNYGTPNQNVGATRSVHGVLGNTFQLAPKLSLKAEIYAQYLYQIPVYKLPFFAAAYASINYQYPSLYDYSFSEQIELSNEGKGLNYGLDLSFEKSFSKNYYFLINTSLYQSKYKVPFSWMVSEKKWLNTRYNGNFILSVTAGKDFTIGKNKNNTLSVNARSIWAGNNRKEFSESNIPFDERLANYFRLDTRVAYMRNKDKYAWTLSLDLQNVSNRINESSNPQINSAGILPYLLYKVEF